MSWNDETVDGKDLLIDWRSPDNNDYKTNIKDMLNNPFDLMEFEAANMDPLDLILSRTPMRGAQNDPPCSNLLTPLLESKNRRIRKSVSLPNLVEDVVDNNYEEFVNGIVVIKEDQSKVVNTKANDDVVGLSNENSFLENLSGNKVANGVEPVFELDPDKEIVEIKPLCNEEEKKQIREETRQKIEKLIEQEQHVYRENCSRRSLSLSTPQHKTNENKDKEYSLLNKGFMKNGSSNSSDGYYSTLNVSDRVDNNNILNASDSVIGARQINSFDLNLLEPEWVVDDLYDDSSVLDVQSKDMSVAVDHDQINNKQKALNCVGTVISKTNGPNKSMLTKRVPMKGPFLANIPLQCMVQNYEDTKPIDRQSLDKPVVTSPLKSDTFAAAVNTPPVKSRKSLTPQSTSKSIQSPKTPLNTKRSSNNVLNDLHGNTPFQPNVLRAKNTTNGSKNMFNVATEKKIGIQNACQVNKSKTTSKIGKFSTPVATNMKKVTGLPVLKRSSMFKGKENVKFKTM